MNTNTLKTLPVAVAFGLALASAGVLAKGNGTGMGLDAAKPQQRCVPTAQTTGSSAKAPQSHVAYDCAPVIRTTTSLAPGATTAKSPARPAPALLSGNAAPMGPGCTAEC
jgi:hypothetical protein